LLKMPLNVLYNGQFWTVNLPACLDDTHFVGAPDIEEKRLFFNQIGIEPYRIPIDSKQLHPNPKAV